jgi:hypothetical protein
MTSVTRAFLNARSSNTERALVGMVGGWLGVVYPFRIIHRLLEGTGSRPVGSRPLFLLDEKRRKGGNGKRFDCSKGSGNR